MLGRMNPETALALNAINRRFYAERAAEWIEKRRDAWPGFLRLGERLPALAAESGKLRVLDVGAGHGRLADQLAQSGLPIEYCGIDFAAALLADARARRFGPHFEFRACDFVADPNWAAELGERYELIALLGVLHHVPSHARRRQLLGQLSARLARQGLLALTFWRLPTDPRFTSRVIPIERYNAAATAPIDQSQLEAGDTLLRWGNSAVPTARYCHFPSASETDTLLRATGLRVIERFFADGRGEQLNEYVVLGR
jgi:SAM-dependent methyltransferase